mmetsp:Transcript_6425/g.13889  ORF Transcript_6425/g.13889 Transcript_6425/m.13889 type:complete len:82 (+) Transcript_6425:197-442(+)
MKLQRNTKIIFLKANRMILMGKIFGQEFWTFINMNASKTHHERWDQVNLHVQKIQGMVYLESMNCTYVHVIVCYGAVDHRY